MTKQTIFPLGLDRREVERLQKRFERLFSVLQESLEAEALETYGTFLPPLDICETANDVLISVEIAGVDAGGIKLTIGADELLIEGLKNASKRTQKGISHSRCERQYGKFRRCIQLRWAIDVQRTKAELKNGILEISLPKLKDRRGQKVTIPVTEIDIG